MALYWVWHSQLVSDIEIDPFFDVGGPDLSTTDAGARTNMVASREAMAKQMATSEVTSYLMYAKTMNWKEVISAHPSPLFQSIGQKDKDLPWTRQLVSYAVHKNIKELWKLFDVLNWWNDFGRQHYPHVMMVASVTLARPYSNAQQERDFSLATWFDGNLVQKQKPATLEKRLMTCLNREPVKMLEETLHQLDPKYKVVETEDEDAGPTMESADEDNTNSTSSEDEEEIDQAVDDMDGANNEEGEDILGF